MKYDVVHQELEDLTGKLFKGDITPIVFDILKDTADNIICHHKSLKLNDLITAKNISLSDLRKSYKQLWLDKDLNKKSSKEKLNENEKI